MHILRHMKNREIKPRSTLSLKQVDGLPVEANGHLATPKETNVKNSLTRLLCTAAIATLAACGGSDEGTSTSPLATYVGSWSSSCIVEGSNSGTLDWNLNTFSDNTLSGQMTVDAYVGNTSCTGTALTTKVPVSMAYDGIKIVSGDSAVKVVITAGTVVYKDLLLIKGGLLYSGVESPIGADGYPDAIDFTDPLTRN
jgi:hypothetical protein